RRRRDRRGRGGAARGGRRVGRGGRADGRPRAPRREPREPLVAGLPADPVPRAELADRVHPQPHVAYELPSLLHRVRLQPRHRPTSVGRTPYLVSPMSPESSVTYVPGLYPPPGEASAAWRVRTGGRSMRALRPHGAQGPSLYAGSLRSGAHRQEAIGRPFPPRLHQLLARTSSAAPASLAAACWSRVPATVPLSRPVPTRAVSRVGLPDLLATPAAAPGTKRRLASGRGHGLHGQPVVRHGAEEHGVAGPLQAEPELVAGDGVVVGGQHGPHRDLDVTVVASMGERDLQALLTGHLTHLGRQPAIHGPRSLADDTTHFLPVVGHLPA